MFSSPTPFRILSVASWDVPFKAPSPDRRGQGLSSSIVNVLWGAFNLVVGYVLVCRVGHFDLHSTDHVIALGLGVLIMGMITARLFGRFHGGNSPGELVMQTAERHLPFAGQLQLSGLGRRRARLQRRHLDAAHRPGLAGAHPADPPERDRGRRGHGAAVRAAAAVAALDRLRGRPLRPAQAPDRDPGAMGALALGLGLLTVAGLVQLWHVYVFAFLLGCVTPFDAPARQTFVSDWSARRDLSNAVALNSTSFNARADDRPGRRRRRSSRRSAPAGCS